MLSSPLSRAVETCRLAGFGDEMEVVEALSEWDYGVYEGRTTDQIRADRPGWELFRDGCPGGESLTEVAGRVGPLIERLRADAALDGAPVLVFAHGHVLRVMTALWAAFGAEAGRALPFETGKVGVLGWSHTDPALVAWNL